MIGTQTPNQPQDVTNNQFIRHELKAPISAIKGYLSMLQEGDYGPLNLTPEQTEVVGKISHNLDDLTNKINTLLKD